MKTYVLMTKVTAGDAQVVEVGLKLADRARHGRAWLDEIKRIFWLIGEGQQQIDRDFVRLLTFLQYELYWYGIHIRTIMLNYNIRIESPHSTILNISKQAIFAALTLLPQHCIYVCLPTISCQNRKTRSFFKFSISSRPFKYFLNRKSPSFRMYEPIFPLTLQ